MKDLLDGPEAQLRTRIDFQLLPYKLSCEEGVALPELLQHMLPV